MVHEIAVQTLMSQNQLLSKWLLALALLLIICWMLFCYIPLYKVTCKPQCWLSARVTQNTKHMQRWKDILPAYHLVLYIEEGLLLEKRFRVIGVEMNTFAVSISINFYLCSHVLLLVFSSPEQHCCLPSQMTNKKKVWLLMLTVPIKLHLHIPVCNGSLISSQKSCDSRKQGSWWVWATPVTERMGLSVSSNHPTFTVLAIQMGKLKRPDKNNHMGSIIP